MLKYIVSFLLVIIPCISFSQQPKIITVKGRVTVNTIKLRWAPSSPILWKQLNKNGVKVEKRIVVRDGKILPIPETILLYDNLTPKPLPEWEEIVQTNDNAAIIAQAIYGESFELSAGNDLGSIVALSEDLEQRFAMSLYAADQSFEAAVMAGWGLVDTDIKPNERYLYTIISAMEGVEEGTVFLATDEVDELPKPYQLSGIWGDRTVMLVWDYGMLKDYYNSYYIERSSNGTDFKRLEGIPVTNLNNKDEQLNQRMYFVDSLSNNNSTYSYRIKGINSFGELGPSSDTLIGKGKSLLRYTPGITRSVINDSNQLELEWDFEEGGNALISGFTLNQSNDANAGYLPVVHNISPISRSLVYDKLEPSNYFTITATAKEGESTTSFPILVQPVDSFPPSIPIGLTGEIDSSGVVRLWWNANREVDLLGYKVYRGFLANRELIQLVDMAVRDTVFTDTVDVHNLNAKVYYGISSVDKRYNQSNLSETLVLDKPDFIKPIPPLISGYKVTHNGIRIDWENSPDTSVVQHRVYRMEKNQLYTPTLLLKTITDITVRSFTDTTAIKDVRYIYTVRSLKKNWLESEPSNAVTLFTQKGKKLLSIHQFNAIVDKPNKMLKLVWIDTLPEISGYEIYKAENDQNPILWQVLSADTKEIIDQSLYINTSYKYLIRAIFKNGSNSKFKEILIEY